MGRKEIFKFYFRFAITTIIVVAVAILLWGRILQFPKDVELQVDIKSEQIIKQNEDIISLIYAMQEQILDIKRDTVSINSRLEHLKSIEEVIEIITEEIEK